MYTWFRDERVTNKLKKYWNEGKLTQDIAKNLNKEFKIRITPSMVRGKVKLLGLTPRSVRGPNKPKTRAAEQLPKPVYSTPSMPPIPPSRFFDKPIKEFQLA